MDMNKVKELYEALGVALGVASSSTAVRGYATVYDVQSQGFARLGAVEVFRDELNANGGRLEKAFAAGMPHWWIVQDLEDYAPLSQEVQDLQEFNCGNARFSLSIQGTAADGSKLWRTYIPAVTRAWDENTQNFVDTPIVGPDRAPVYAVSGDARTIGGRVTVTNPRVADMAKVVRAAFDYFKKVNSKAVLPLPA